jgi:hypothetical protein
MDFSGAFGLDVVSCQRRSYNPPAFRGALLGLASRVGDRQDPAARRSFRAAANRCRRVA